MLFVGKAPADALAVALVDSSLLEKELAAGAISRRCTRFPGSVDANYGQRLRLVAVKVRI